MSHLIIGIGEVGSALRTILNADAHDPHKEIWAQEDEKYDFVHIAFPFDTDFSEKVNRYKKVFLKPEGILVIHSSVAVGISDMCEAVHSPIRGVHPKLELGIRTFVKYFGGPRAAEAAKEFKIRGMDVKVFESAKITEAMKLWDTTQYGAMILLQKEIKEWCDKNGVDFESVYTEANKTYNEGYRRLSRHEVVRPYLKDIPGKIGGHCVIQNAALLDSPTPKQLIHKNATL